MCLCFLFRGVSVETHESKRGLFPKGPGFTRTMHLDDGLHLDTRWTLDDSCENAVIGHQLNSGKYQDAGISTTPHFERAKYYATSGFKSSGVVYKISRCKLYEHGVQEYVVSTYTPPKCPEDDEVILVHHELGPLPRAIITDVIYVQP
jgi:hypothetical protein